MALREYTDDEYETLQRSEREIAGNRERATVTDVTVGDDTARLAFGFDWKPESESVTFDLDRERDVMELQSVAAAAGYEYDQLPYLEDEPITVAYLDGRWVPAAALPDGGPASLSDASPTAPSLTDRTRRRASEWLDDLTVQSVVLGVIVTKKLLIVSALVYLIVT
ncbi:hypothetical protein [Halosimplex salinum]|uniref:hypothetical protein n=1 Tax=Halosimplex salinum TaxID=1710538 RepID=UPI000F484577|nr:hypothetical protein [Halosimplex salinum]